jgi:hypothetical protein
MPARVGVTSEDERDDAIALARRAGHVVDASRGRFLRLQLWLRLQLRLQQRQLGRPPLRGRDLVVAADAAGLLTGLFRGAPGGGFLAPPSDESLGGPRFWTRRQLQAIVLAGEHLSNRKCQTPGISGERLRHAPVLPHGVVQLANVGCELLKPPLAVLGLDCGGQVAFQPVRR